MRIPLTSGFTLIPEGVYVFRIYDVEEDEDFGKIEFKLVNAQGATLTERFSIMKQDGEYNEGALNALSYFIKTALNRYDLGDLDEVDTKDTINHYIKAEVKHTKLPSTKDPSKTVTFANLGDKFPAEGFDTEPVEKALTLGKPATTSTPAAKKPAPATTPVYQSIPEGLNLDELLNS